MPIKVMQNTRPVSVRAPQLKRSPGEGLKKHPGACPKVCSAVAVRQTEKKKNRTRRSFVQYAYVYIDPASVVGAAGKGEYLHVTPAVEVENVKG